MVAEILLVPEEDALDSGKASAQYVARRLGAMDIKVRESVSLCTDRKKLQQAAAVALERSNIVFVLGGLDKESDFLAKTVLCQGLGIPLSDDMECLEIIRDICQRNDLPFSDGDAAYAEVPHGAEVLYPSQGKAPGFVISSSSQHIIMLPDNQQELSAMFNRYVTPYLGGQDPSATVTHVLRTYGAPEDYVREKLLALTASSNPAVTIQKDGNEVLIRVTAHGTSYQEAASLCMPALKEAARIMGDLAYGLDVDSIQEAVIGKTRKKNLGISIAEAGTGGTLTRVIGETIGGADVLRYSTGADDADAKVKKLDISPRLLRKRGNVSEYAAVAMAAGARKRGGSELGVAITANNGFRDKKSQPGLVYIAVCDDNYVYVKRLVVGDGDVDSDIIVDAAISRALNMIRLFVDYLPDPYKGCILLEEALQGATVTDKDAYDEDFPDTDHRSGWFARHFVIRKADGPADKVKKFVCWLAVLALLGCGAYLTLRLYRSQTGAQQAESLRALYLEDAEYKNTVDSKFPAQYLQRFGPLWSVNSDVVGFVSVEDTAVAYPVVQATDNQFYARRDFYKKDNGQGIPFLDYRVDIGRPSDNLVIHGHSMTDGQLLGELLQYQTLDYFKAHPLLTFDTLYEENQYKIFAVFITNARSDQGEVFAYHDFINAASDRDFEKYVEQLQLRSIIDTGVDVRPGDMLVTLSTRTYEFEDARFVLVGRKLRAGEDPMSDVDEARMSLSPLYPDIWYEQFGGTRPDVDSASVVTSTATRPNSQVPVSVSELVVSGASSSAEVSAVASSEPEESTSEPTEPPSSPAPASSPESQSEAETGASSAPSSASSETSASSQ
ncbi:CinA family protein, partial [Ruminococcaceae bacterium OttesenSCG-928-L11]|nr:CinA family protein [Ruminococcaceae bacterium OttesenSCG-928-L11]